MQRLLRNIQNSAKNFFEYYPAGPRERAWTLHLATTGFARISGGLPYPPPRHPKGHSFTWERGRVLSGLQVVAIVNGKGFLEWREGAVKVEKGEVFVIPPGIWHRYRPDQKTGWTEQWFELRGPATDQWISSDLLEMGTTKLPRAHSFWRLFEELHAVCRAHRAGFREVSAGLGMTLLAMVLSSNRRQGAGIPEIVREARHLLMQGHDVMTVSQKLGVGYQTLYREFKNSTGLSPKEYSKDVRLSRAEELLSGTPLGLKEIAARLGYFSASHFSLEFKRARGTAPAHWRRSVKHHEMTAGNARRVGLKVRKISPL